ncbi:reverse transcriptase family protein [Pseudomonas putida]|uniref:reverse transcriptase family protein n=1 Tax=Pseudomonas putida TaxID=303 RepID=UPI002759C33B|nr:reverse transcriptase family protein [Pseudomonas putida]MDP9523888.1 reverse transcriptase family protein [Pseudomonas putida]
MKPQANSIKKPRSFEFHLPNQSALFKVTSPRKLAKVLNRTETFINNILQSEENYREFTLLEELNPFSQKRKKARLVQTPCSEMRSLHQRLLKLLQRIQYPDYAHAGVKKRSYRSNAQAHQHSKEVATFDLKDYYGSVKSHHVYDFFLNHLKCAKDVSGILARLSTHRNCVPTGSPLSPLLALHSSLTMFNDLQSLANKYGLIFTCYVDDITFSGNSIPSSLEREAISIVRRYGHRINKGKTRVFREHQPKHVTGTIITNGKITVPYARMITVRRLQAAIDGKIDNFGFTEFKLREKLAGVLNEASYLDPKFQSKALIARGNLKPGSSPAPLSPSRKAKLPRAAQQPTPS